MDVSVIVPSYNTASLLTYTVRSVLSSTFINYEVLIIDDGSKDNTTEVVQPFLANKNIHYIKQKNKGLAGARNTGIKHANGKYLVFLDSDDIILPEKLEKQCHFFQANPGLDVVYNKSIFFLDKAPSKEFLSDFPVYKGEIFRNLLFGNFIHVNAAMVRTEVVKNIGLFDESLRELEDWDLWLRLSLNGSKFGYIDEVLSKVRVRSNSMTVNQLKMNQTMVKVLEKLKTLMLEKGGFEHHKKDYYHAYHLFRLQADYKQGYIPSLLNAIKQTGISFSLPFTKLLVKYMLSHFINFRNATTQHLEVAWKNS